MARCFDCEALFETIQQGLHDEAGPEEYAISFVNYRGDEAVKLMWFIVMILRQR